MSDNSKIEWTDSTWNPIRARRKSEGVQVGDHRWRSALPGGKPGWYCEHVSPGCEHCYAESMNRHLGTCLPFKPGHRQDVEIFLDEKMLLAPLRWKKPRRIFLCSMTDAFADFVKDEWLDRIFAVMALTPQHRYQVLTKRAARMREYMSSKWRISEQFAKQILDLDGFKWPPLNCWLGVSAEDQQRADERIPLLLETPAAVRFVSLEPLLGPITLWRMDEDEGGLRGPGVKISGGVTGSTPDNPPEGYDDSQPWLDWVIVGGESGPNARPMKPEWARHLRNQCERADVPFFFKQWGEWFAGEVRVGKKAAGRLLDGVEWNQMPERS